MRTNNLSYTAYGITVTLRFKIMYLSPSSMEQIYYHRYTGSFRYTYNRDIFNLDIRGWQKYEFHQMCQHKALNPHHRQSVNHHLCLLMSHHELQAVHHHQCYQVYPHESKQCALICTITTMMVLSLYCTFFITVTNTSIRRK